MTLRQAIEAKLGRPLTQADVDKLDRLKRQIVLPDPAWAFANGVSLDPKRPDLHVWRLGLKED